MILKSRYEYWYRPWDFDIRASNIDHFMMSYRQNWVSFWLYLVIHWCRAIFQTFVAILWRLFLCYRVVHITCYYYEVVLCRICVWHQTHVLCTFKNLPYVRLLCPSVWLCRCNHGFKYRPILIHIGNIVSDFEVPDMRLTP